MPKSVIRDEIRFGARFGPLALEGSAPKILWALVGPSCTSMPNLVTVGLAVLLEIAFRGYSPIYP